MFDARSVEPDRSHHQSSAGQPPSHEARRNVSTFCFSREKDRLKVGVKVAIHVRYLQLIFGNHRSAETTNQGDRPPPSSRSPAGEPRRLSISRRASLGTSIISVRSSKVKSAFFER